MKKKTIGNGHSSYVNAIRSQQTMFKQTPFMLYRNKVESFASSVEILPHASGINIKWFCRCVCEYQPLNVVHRQSISYDFIYRFICQDRCVYTKCICCSIPTYLPVSTSRKKCKHTNIYCLSVFTVHFFVVFVFCLFVKLDSMLYKNLFCYVN